MSMLPFAELAVFAAVAESEGFTAAARRLGQSKAAVSDQVRRLEARLGARLLNRTTRRVTLTEAGAACLAHCRRMLQEADAAARIAEALQSEPAGRLRLTAPQTFGPMHIAPAIASFSARHPRLDVELQVSAERLDLLGAQLDLAIRLGPLPDSRLVARRVGLSRQVLVAAPAYLAAHGAPATVADLARHATLLFTGLPWGAEWRIADPRGRVRRVPLQPRFASDAGEALLEASRAGMGIGFMPDWMVHRAVEAGDLAVVLPGFGRPNIPVHAVHASAGQPPAKIRLFIDHLRRHFGDPPYWSLKDAAA